MPPCAYRAQEPGERIFKRVRHFVFVKDVVKANINACKSDYNGVVNVASGEKITINKLYEVVKKTLGSDFEPKYLPERPGDIKHSLADVSNMEKIGCNISSKDFEKQLELTINWFKTQL